MLEHDIEMPDGWQTAWLQRTSPLLHCYTTLVSYSLSLTIIVLGVGGFLAIRRSTKKLAQNPNNRLDVFSKMNKKLLRITKGHFFVAIIYMLHVVLVSMVDAVICGVALSKNASSDPEAWNKQLLIEAILYCSYLLSVFIAPFILVPLSQMLVITWMLARMSNKYGRNALADYIPEARFFSTHIAQIWCMMLFFVVSWWPPSDNGSLWRYVVLQGCFGSAIAWLEASFVFNFHADRLQDEDIDASNRGVKEILRMFTRTVKAVHITSEKSAGLPRFEVLHDLRPIPTKEEEEFCR